jgi:hypothetical protein
MAAARAMPLVLVQQEMKLYVRFLKRSEIVGFCITDNVPWNL